MHGAVLEGMSPEDKPVKGKKNDPMMPLVWSKDYASKSGNTARIFCTTMGSSTDFESADLRRLIVNASLWAVDRENKIDGKANVDYVSPYKPTQYGFGNYVKGAKPADHDLRPSN